MLQVTVIAVGKCRERHFSETCAEYLKRLTAFCRPVVVEVGEYRLPREPGEAQIRQCLLEEGRAILSKIPPKAHVVALCVEGKPLTSAQFAAELERIGQTAPAVAFVVGGSNGLSEAVKETASLRLSLSAMTLPHQLARVVLLEQLYRAFAIIANLKYHK